ncbi:uncharacterized protein LOC128170024 [Crassostrea angulata]|uniref:uncharacterized protein LOC128170024 n=1 Tax=Magallana angulata TaxID=2784310 RepID=UPI0022B0F443|nr:uncharacterized protein LOC128170024 [Crassostrea angulata]
MRVFGRRTNDEKKIASLYRDLETFLKSDDFTDELRNELQQSNPDYLTVLEKRIKDIEKVDHGIVIAGETSAGKSTLINKILEKRIFKGRNNESTSTICKIRNSAKTRILTESMTGQIDETDLTEKNDVEKALRDSLKKLTDMTSSEECIHFRSVDIGFLIPFLKDNTIIVDTPGIGGSGLVTEKLMEYLPNALSFIFVINVASAGGMQKDRLPEILKSIIQLQMRNEMPCFECDNVIFITNKWDTIVTEYDSSEEDEETKTWKKLQSDIKERWPLVKEENIFKLNLKDVSHEQQNCSTKEFKRFRQVLELNIKKAENIRVERHLRD